MTEPTDAEIVELMRDGYNCRYNDEADHIDFARAVLAKWGTPPAVAGEPVAEFDEWFGRPVLLYGAPMLKHKQKLYTTPQAGTVPMTPEAINAMAREYPAEDLCGWIYRMGVADAEQRHGIKGGQHGAE